MTVHKQVRAGGRLAHEVLPEGKEPFNVRGLGRHATLEVLDHVVETQFQALVLAKAAEGRRRWVTGVKNRQHVADADIAMSCQLLDTADGQIEVDELGVHDQREL